VPTARGLVEVAGLGRRAGLVVHGATSARLALPPGDYLAAAAADDLVYLVSNDRGLYRSQLVAVELSDDGPRVAAIESFSGSATAVAVDGERLYVGDTDRGVRVYQRLATSLAPLGVVELQAAWPSAPPPIPRAKPVEVPRAQTAAARLMELQ
jgi:hypothetical protein